MAIYKYVPSISGRHYLANWRLRLSPASALNDPFEFKPIFSKSYEDAFNARLETAYCEIDRERGTTKEERLAQ